MNEQRWAEAVELSEVMRILSGTLGRVSGEKMRLFGCACCRVIWPHLTDRSRAAVEVAERYAQGGATRHELAAVPATATPARGRPRARSGDGLENAEVPARAAAACLEPDGVEAGRQASSQAAWWVSMQTDRDPRPRGAGATGGCANIYHQERRRQAFFLRDLFGNPFRPRRVPPEWLSYGDAAVPRLARAARDTWDVTSFPVLADALEDAGCDDADLLSHLRGPGPHVRGCWALDLLGKQ